MSHAHAHTATYIHTHTKPVYACMHKRSVCIMHIVRSSMRSPCYLVFYAQLHSIRHVIYIALVHVSICVCACVCASGWVGGWVGGRPGVGGQVFIGMLSVTVLAARSSVM